MKIRDCLRQIIVELGIKNGSYTRDEVIEAFRNKHAGLLRESSRTLENIALRRILNDVESRQSRSFSASQLELFPELVGLPLSLEHAGRRILSQKNTLNDIRRRVSQQLVKVRQRNNIDLWAELLEKIDPDSMFGELSLEEAICNFRARNQA